MAIVYLAISIGYLRTFVYAADTCNNTIRHITPQGMVTTVVGTPGSKGIRTGPLPASLSLSLPLAVAIGPDGVMVISSDAALLIVK